MPQTGVIVDDVFFILECLCKMPVNPNSIVTHGYARSEQTLPRNTFVAIQLLGLPVPSELPRCGNRLSTYNGDTNDFSSVTTLIFIKMISLVRN